MLPSPARSDDEQVDISSADFIIFDDHAIATYKYPHSPFRIPIAGYHITNSSPTGTRSGRDTNFSYSYFESRRAEEAATFSNAIEYIHAVDIKTPSF